MKKPVSTEKLRLKLDKNLVFFVLVTLSMAAMVWFGLNSDIHYSPINMNGISFVPGKVTQVVSETIETDQRGLKRGRQDLQVELLSGARKGDVIDVVNYLSVDHNYYVKAGQGIIVYLDQQPGETYYSATVQSYDRTWALCAAIVLFFVLLAVVSGKTGIRSAFGLLFTFVVVFGLLIPLIVRGAPPVPLALGLVLCIVVVSLISILGFTKKTTASIVGTGLGIVICCLLFGIISYMLQITGYNVSQVDALVLIENNTDIRIGGFLFIGVLIASLGGVMDVSVSVASSVAELKDTNPTLSFKSLFRSGVVIGRDVVGATLNTLIMAFTGSAFVSLILFRIYDYPLIMLINNDEIVIEVLQALASSSALILCAPITAFITARVYTNTKKKL